MKRTQSSKYANKLSQKEQWKILAIFLVILTCAIVAIAIACYEPLPEIVAIYFNDDITVAIGDSEPVDFTVATETTEESDRVAAATAKLDLQWTIGDESIAEYKDGEVVGVSKGETTLHVESADGSVSDDCTVTVTTTSEAATAETAKTVEEILNG